MHHGRALHNDGQVFSFCEYSDDFGRLDPVVLPSPHGVEMLQKRYLADYKPRHFGVYFCPA